MSTEVEEFGPEVEEPWRPIWSGRRKLSAQQYVSPQTEERRRIFRSLSDPQETGEQLIQGTLEALNRNFETPVVEVDPNSGRRLIFERVGELEAEEPPDPYDYKAIRDARLRNRTYGSRIRGTFRVREADAEGNTIRVLDESKRTLALVPTPVYDRSFITKGKPRTLQTQFRRKPGVFSNYNAAGELITEFNLDPFTPSRVKNFKVAIDQDADTEGPEFYLQYGGAKKIPAWDLARAFGATDADLEKQVGKEVAQAITSRSSDARYEKTIRNLHARIIGDKERAMSSEVPFDEIRQEVVGQFASTSVDPEIVQSTIGVSSGVVDRDVLLSSFGKLKRIATKEEEPDDRESLALKTVLSPNDLIAEAVGRDAEVNKFRRSVSSKLRGIRGQIYRADAAGTDAGEKIRVDRFISGQFNPKIEQKLSRSMVQQTSTGTNPLDALAHATQTTIMGEGAISSDRGVPSEAKLISGSSLGFIDPVHTPESDRAGVSLNLSARTRIRPDASNPGRSELATLVLDRDGREVELTPAQMLRHTVGAFDQYEMKGGKPRPRGENVRAFRAGNPVEVKPKDIEYWLPDHHSIFDVNTALVPFQNSAQGNRVQYADKQLPQAVPLINREEPLVQVKAPGSSMTVEELLGEEAGAVDAPFDGKVLDIVDRGVDERYMVLQPKGTKERVRINLAKNLPTGGHTPFDTKPIVQKGDEFKRGQPLADSTFTKNGKLALGVNLRTAYLPYSSHTFEDALVVSETAARKLTSEHLYEEVRDEPNIKYGKKEFLRRSAGGVLSSEELSSLDEDGVIKVGARVKPGQTLMVGSRGLGNLEKGEQVRAIQQAAALGLFDSKDKRNLRTATVPFQHTWKSEFEGEVVDVRKDKDGQIRVHVRTEEPFQAGDKLYGRHGNKGVAAIVMPDADMPYNPNVFEVKAPGKSNFKVGQEIPKAEAERLMAVDSTFQAEPAKLELLLNPLGIPSRMNPSQNFETFLGKLAKKNGTPETVENFAYDSNWDYVNNRLKQAGVDDAEDLVDPVSGRTLQGIGVGTQYITKAKQSVAHKSDARGVGAWTKKGLASKSVGGAQALGELGTYGLLAQDAREFLRDAQLYKSENRPEVWEALEMGRELPPIRDPEQIQALGRFKNYLTAAGIDMVHDRQGHKFRLKPLTDKDVEELTKSHVGGDKYVDRVIPRPTEIVQKKGDKLEKGGLFDPEITGGLDGNNWSRFELAARLPNPTYEKPIRDILGISKSDYDKITLGVASVEVGDEELSGARAIERMLQTVDLNAVRDSAEKAAASGRTPSERSRAYRTLKSIDMLEKNKLRPDEAFLRKQVAVAPPSLRSIDTDEDGNIVYGDLNFLYRDIALANEEVKKAYENNLPPKAIARLERGLYDTVRTLMHVEGSQPLAGDYQGVLGTLAGISYQDGTPVSDVKKSLLKSELVERRQAFSGRSVLSPDDSLGLDEAAIPYNMAAAMLEPQVIAEYRRRTNADGQRISEFQQRLQTYSQNDERDSEIEGLLQTVVRDQPMVLKRDPVLHKYGVQGFKPKLTHNKTVSLNPLVYGGLAADNDGDTLAVFAPLSRKAKDEVYAKMLPSKNLLNPATGGLEYGIGHEALFGITRATKEGKRVNKSFASKAEAKQAYDSQEIGITDIVRVAGQETSLGRLQFNDSLPSGITLESLRRDGVISDQDLKSGIGKKQLSKVLEGLATSHTQSYGEVANRLRIFGQEQATYTNASLTMSDLQPLLADERKKTEKQLSDRVSKIMSNRSLTDKQRREQVRSAFGAVVEDLNKRSEAEWKRQLEQERPNTLTQMVSSGARAKFHQLKQITVAPIGLVDGANELVPVPVMRNYSDGLDAAGYWTAAAGARMGAVSKVQEVREPGYLSKQLLNTSMDRVVTEPDCGTKKGVPLEVSKKSDHRDLAGRTLARPLSIGNVRLPAGHTVTSNDVSDMLRALKDGASMTATVRSPLSCEADSGVCQKCAGADLGGQPMNVGSNLGLQAGQALGERSVQLTISTFHGGGVFDPKAGSAADLYAKASSLLRMPGSMGGQRSEVWKGNSEVESVSRNANKGGWDLKTKDQNNYFIPFGERAPGNTEVEEFYKPGTKVRAGRPITDGLANPKDILQATGNIEDVQNYMTEELGNIFGTEGVRRRNVEMVVRSMTDTVEISDAGGAPGVFVGERMPLTQAKKLSRQHPGLRYRAILRGVDVAPRELREDFLAQLNFNNIRNTITDAAAKGSESDYHGFHPIPGLVTGFATSPWMSRRLRDRGAY